MNGQEHYAEAEQILDAAEESALEHSDEWYANAMRAAQAHATLAQTAATRDLAAAIGNLPNYEGMLAVYNFGGTK